MPGEGGKARSAHQIPLGQLPETAAGRTPVQGEHPLRVTLPDRRHPVVRRVVHAWRMLCDERPSGRAGRGKPTLVAASGGADSSALVICLAAVGAPITLGHVIHDMRPAAEARADAQRVEALAAALGVPVRVAEVRLAAAGGGLNAEAGYRRLRYAALAEMAKAAGCGWVATGHHAHDQLESVLMALARGSGPRGLAGLAPVRRLARGAMLMRPMLGISPDQAKALCQSAGWAWAEDPTNAETSRLRAAIRHTVLPPLLAARPSAARASVRSGPLLWGAAEALETLAGRVAREVVSGPDGRAAAVRFQRAELRRQPAAVVSTAIKAAWQVVGDLGKAAGETGPQREVRSRLRGLAAVVRAVRSGSTDPKRFALGPATVTVTAHAVEVVGGGLGPGRDSDP
jgi:tRNA(Ile)-lysidine synthase